MKEGDLTRRSFVKQSALAAVTTLARYAALGHTVTIVYLTRGERGIAGKSLDEAARIRTAATCPAYEEIHRR